MPTTYGTNDAFNDAREIVITALNALGADMVSNSVSPRFAAVSSGVYCYRTHWTDPAFVFNSVSVSLSEVTHVQVGQMIEYLYRVELRIMTGNDNQPFDEETFMNLANSVLNWFFSHQTLGSGYYVKPSIPIEVTPNVQFPDTRTVGGTVQFTMFGLEAYTQL